MAVTVTRSIPLWDGHARATWDPADKVPVGDRRFVPREILVQIRGGPKEPDLAMRIEVREGIPQWAEVRLQARPDGPEIRDKHLAAIHLGDWLNQIVAACSLGFSGADADGIVWSKPNTDRGAVADIRRAVSGRPRTVTPERLQKVAEVYRQHFGNRPTEAVARSFGVSHRTAARYVQMCRNPEHGLLPKTDKGKKRA
jgi:hypothetical protein